MEDLVLFIATLPFLVILAIGINQWLYAPNGPVDRISQKIKALRNPKCRAKQHDWQRNDYLFYEYDELVSHCRSCGLERQGSSSH